MGSTQRQQVTSFVALKVLLVKKVKTTGIKNKSIQLPLGPRRERKRFETVRDCKHENIALQNQLPFIIAPV